MALRTGVKVTGVRAVIKNLKKVKVTSQGGLEKGLMKAGLFLQAASQKIVPVDTGALRNSAFTRLRWKGTKRADVLVGYTQSYAVYVHENLEARHAPGKQAKFLETPAKLHRKKLLEIIQSEMKKYIK